MKEPSRILIIDDDPLIHGDFRKILLSDQEELKIDKVEHQLFGHSLESGLENYQTKLINEPINYAIDSAYSGEEGLAYIQQALTDKKPYALLFVDILMPSGWGGLETIKLIWHSDSFVQTVICTAYSDYSWRELVNTLGLSDRLLILKKPFDSIEVRQIACCLTRKWALDRQLNQRLNDLQRSLFR
jgi:diguanylate cyclase